MKILRSVVLAVALSAAACYAQAPAPATPPVQTLELNAGLCGPRSLGIYHVVTDGKKISFDYYLVEDGSVVQDKTPLTFDYQEGKALDDGAITFEGSTIIEKQKYEIVGARYKNRVAAFVKKDSRILFVYYGVAGPLDDLVKVKDAAMGACEVFLSADDLPQAIAGFLYGADNKEDKQEDPDVKKT